MNTKLLLAGLVLALSSLACATIMGSNDNNTGAADIDAVQDSIAPTPETANQGIHNFSVTVTEQGCDLFLSEEIQTRQILFSGSQVQISNNEDLEVFERYELTGEHRYLRYNTAKKAVVDVFSLDGYFLEIYETGADPNADSPCGFFTFTLAD